MEAASLAGLTLHDPEGGAVPMEHLLEGDPRPRWLLIQAVRYYG